MAENTANAQSHYFIELKPKNHVKSRHDNQPQHHFNRPHPPTQDKGFQYTRP